jgi:hypothetical protein
MAQRKVIDSLNTYPLTKNSFFSWFIGEYGADESIFKSAPFLEQCKVIARYLGYPYEFPDKWSETDIHDKINDYLYIYESILKTHPFGTIDPFKIITKMDYKERETKYPDMNIQREIHYGLSMSVIDRIKSFDIKSDQKLYLNNAIINIAVIYNQEAENKILDNLIKNPLRYEDVPF